MAICGRNDGNPEGRACHHPGPGRGQPDPQQGLLWRPPDRGVAQARPHGGHLPGRVRTGSMSCPERMRSRATELLRLAHRGSEGFEVQLPRLQGAAGSRGYVVKLGASPLDFRVFPRGGSPNKTPSKWWVSAISERSTVRPGCPPPDLDRTDGRAGRNCCWPSSTRRAMSPTTRSGGPRPRAGSARSTSAGPREGLPHGRPRARERRGRARRRCHGGHFFGKQIGPMLQLSLIEAAFLDGARRAQAEGRQDRPRRSSLATLKKTRARRSSPTSTCGSARSRT